jgi:hypothetical protein
MLGGGDKLCRGMPRQSLCDRLLACLDGGRATEARVRADVVVIGLPESQHEPDLGERREERLVEAFVPEPANEALGERVLLRLAGRNIVPADAGSCDQRRIAMLVSSVPLSLTTIAGLPRRSISRSSSRATRRPESEVSAIRARHSRLKSSTTTRMRKRRPSVRASLAKSRDQRWFGCEFRRSRPVIPRGSWPGVPI